MVSHCYFTLPLFHHQWGVYFFIDPLLLVLFFLSIVCSYPLPIFFYWFVPHFLTDFIRALHVLRILTLYYNTLSCIVLLWTYFIKVWCIILHCHHYYFLMFKLFQCGLLGVPSSQLLCSFFSFVRISGLKLKSYKIVYRILLSLLFRAPRC